MRLILAIAFLLVSINAMAVSLTFRVCNDFTANSVVEAASILLNENGSFNATIKLNDGEIRTWHIPCAFVTEHIEGTTKIWGFSCSNTKGDVQFLTYKAGDETLKHANVYLHNMLVGTSHSCRAP